MTAEPKVNDVQWRASFASVKGPKWIAMPPILQSRTSGSIQRFRRGLADGVEAVMEHELLEQTWQKQPQDFPEGVKAMAERRPPVFVGR
jgi:hypothetical protein